MRHCFIHCSWFLSQRLTGEVTPSVLFLNSGSSLHLNVQQQRALLPSPLFFPPVFCEATCHSPLSILLLLSVSFPPSLLHSIIVSIYLFYSPSAAKLCRPSIPPTPCALTALSLDGSSSSKAVTMMDCRLPPTSPSPVRSFSLCPSP